MGECRLEVTLRDDYGAERLCTLRVDVVEQKEYAIILGRPFLGMIPLDVNWQRPVPQWRFRDEPPNVEFSSGEDFEKELQGQQVFAVILETMREGEASASRQIPAWAVEWIDVFDKEKATAVPHDGLAEHAIELTDGKQPPYGPIYPLGEEELATLRAYLEDALATGRIRYSVSPAGAPILFTRKKDGGLRLCVDYRGLNAITIKNRHALPLITELLDRVAGAKWFTKLDLAEAYHRICIKKGDEWKTAFRCRYGHYEYVVMPFGLANAPATFQAHINRCLNGLVDSICVVFMDDILIYSVDATSHRQHVCEVLQRLREYDLYVKLSKCEFEKQEVSFLGFVINGDGVTMESNRVDAITEWPEPSSVRDLQVFLGFANFYRRFIERYSFITAALTALVTANGPFDLGEEGRKAFNQLKERFVTAPLLRHFDKTRVTRLETDASQRAIGGIMSQKQDNGQWHPTAFYSRKLKGAEVRYHTHDLELLAIVEAAQHWRHYLLSARGVVEVITDHDNLKYFLTTKRLSGRQARAAEALSQYNIEIKFRAGERNPADGLSRRPDYDLGKGDEAENEMVPVLQGLFAPELRRLQEGIASSNARSPLTTPEEPDSMRDAAAPACRGLQDGMSEAPDERTSEKATQPDPTKLEELECMRGVAAPACGSLQESVRMRGGGKTSIRVTQPEVPPSDEPLVVGAWRQEDDGCARPSSRGRLAVIDGSPIGGANSSEWRKTSSSHSPADDVATSPSGDRVGGTAVEMLASELVEEPPEADEGFDLASLIVAAQQGDAFVGRQKDLLESPESRVRADSDPPSWSVDSSGVLFQNDKVYVPDRPGLKWRVIEHCHDDPSAGHYGVAKTKDLVSRKYYWSSRAADVEQYIKYCDRCQRHKSRRHRQYGVLQSLEIPEAKELLKHWSMDFVTGLPLAKNRHDEVVDAILVMVDRLSKLAVYKDVRSDIDARGLADVVEEALHTVYGTPSSIVTDRGSVFTSKYWTLLMRRWQSQRRLSTAFHPQTDGQTERQNQTMETYLRCFINHEQNDWPYWLRWAEFSYNNAEQSSLKCSPLQFVYAMDVRRPGDIVDEVAKRGGKIQEPDVPAVTERMKKLTQMRERLRENLREAVAYQARYYNRKHRPRNFEVGDEVMLMAKNLRTIRPKKKYAARFVGPFKIEEKIGRQAYRLALSPRMGAIHPVFHVSLLEPYYRSGNVAPPPEEVEGEEEWEVEAVCGIGKTVDGKTQYLVKWKGYPEHESTWEPAQNLRHAGDAIQKYLDSVQPVEEVRSKRKKLRRR